MNKLSKYFLLLNIVGLALVLRLVNVSQVPPGLNRDEAAIGYNAYSLLKTGRDEYGKSWPLSFKSFGDWKVPAYFYMVMPFVQLLGLTELAVRLPSGLLGTATVFLTYYLVCEILAFRSINQRSDTTSVLTLAKSQIDMIALLAAFILAITPWHVFMSRNASESNVAVFFAVLGLWTFFRSFQNKKLLLVSFIAFALTLYTYHGNHIFTPLFILGLCTIYWRECLANPWFKTAGGIFILLSAIIFSQTLLGADKTKISGLFPLSDQSKVYADITLRRLEYKNNQLLAKLIHNKPLYLIETVVNNYLKGFSSEFLFIKGGDNAQHNIPGFGNLLVWEAPFIFLGICILLNAKQKNGYFLVYWLLISPLAASITRDAPHTARMMGFLPLPAILAAYGLGISGMWIWRRKVGWIFSIGMGVIIGIYLILYLDQYFVHFPLVSAKDWGYGYKQLVDETLKLQSKYKQVFIARPEVSPYIYFLFYGQLDPETYQKTIVRYPETTEGFAHVRQMDKLYFQQIDWADELLIPNRLYIDWVEGVPSGATASAVIIDKPTLAKLIQNGQDVSELTVGDKVVSRIVDTIKLPDHKPYIYLIETRTASPSALPL